MENFLLCVVLEVVNFYIKKLSAEIISWHAPFWGDPKYKDINPFLINARLLEGFPCSTCGFPMFSGGIEEERWLKIR